MKTLETIELTPLTLEECAMIRGGEQSAGIPIKVQGADGMVGELPTDSEP